MLKSVALIALTSLGLAQGALAGVSGSTKTAAPESKHISASILIDTSTTLAPGADNSAGEGYSQSGLYRLDVGVPLPGNLTASVRTGYSQEYTYVTDDGSSGGLIDSRLALSMGMGEILKNLSLS